MKKKSKLDYRDEVETKHDTEPNMNDLVGWIRVICNKYDNSYSSQFFLDLFGPPWRGRNGESYEGLRKEWLPDGSTKWIWPYADRIKYQTRRFLIADADLRALIVDAAADGIYWRGDDLDFFKTAISDTHEMRKIGKSAFIESAKVKVRNLRMEG